MAAIVSREKDRMTATRNNRTAISRARHSAPDNERRPIPLRLGVVTKVAAANSQDVPVSQTMLPALSVRAENVLKILVSELTGEQPPRGRWTPSDLLLERLTYRHLLTARNCGPRTTAEIVKWAEARGTILRPPFHAGTSLSTMWQHTIAKFSAGEISTTEVAEALEYSTRRRNTRIPVELQKILLQLIRPANG
jgi:hypothetical protein